MLRVILVTEDWLPYASTDGWTQAVTRKESKALKYYEAVIWEETASVHLYEFPNDYDAAAGVVPDQNGRFMTDDEKIAHREQHAIATANGLPPQYTQERSTYLANVFEEIADVLTSRHPQSEHHLMYSGHGAPGGDLFALQLRHEDAAAFLRSWTQALGRPLGVIDMGGPCTKGSFNDLQNFCQFSRYYVASDMPNGGYRYDDWTLSKNNQTDPELQYHRLFSSNDDLESALVGRINLKRTAYEYSRNDMVTNAVQQANYLYSCDEFKNFQPDFSAFFRRSGADPNTNMDLLQFLILYAADQDLIDKFRRVFLHRADNRDFFDWQLEANGMLVFPRAQWRRPRGRDRSSTADPT